jgi:Cation transporter/ATPase, N-terminus
MGKSRRDEGGPWHTSVVAEALRALDTELGSGLSSEEAARRLKKMGPSELEDRGGRKP